MYDETDEETDEETEFEVHTNVTVRNVNRTIDFDDFVNGLAEEVATERENNQTQLDDDDSDIGDIPELESVDGDYSSDDDFSDDDSCGDDDDDNMSLQEDWSSRFITV